MNMAGKSIRKRKVCFARDAALAKIHMIEKIDYEHYEEIWYSGDDYMDMKYESKMEAKHWRRYGFHMLLAETFRSPREDAQRYIDAFVLLEENLCRRGLERSLSKQHGRERKILKDLARFSVLSEQRRLLKLGASSDQVEKALYQIYHPLCQSGVLFARRLAISDELFVERGEDSSFAEAILIENGIPVGDFRPRVERRGSMGSVDSACSYDSTKMMMQQGMMQQGFRGHNRDLPPRRAGRRHSPIGASPVIPRTIGGIDTILAASIA